MKDLPHRDRDWLERTVLATIEVMEGATEEELSEYFGVARSTIYRLLRQAEEQGKIFRVEGYAGQAKLWATRRRRIQNISSPLLCNENANKEEMDGGAYHEAEEEGLL